MNKEQQIEEMANYYCEYCKKQTGEKFCEHIDDKSCNIFFEAELFCNAGYRKIFTSDFASDTQKAYKEGYIKGIEETEAEIEHLKADNEALTMWNNASAETIQKLSETNKRFASNMKSVLEIEKKNAVKEFAEKLKERMGERDYMGVKYKQGVFSENDIDGLLKEYEQ